MHPHHRFGTMMVLLSVLILSTASLYGCGDDPQSDAQDGPSNNDGANNDVPNNGAENNDTGNNDAPNNDEPVPLCDVEVEPRGDRMLGIDLLDTDQSGNFETNLEHARELGIDFIALHVLWDQLEPTPGQFTDPFNAIEALGQVAQANGWKFALTIRPIDLTGKTVPDDLEGTRFNDPIMAERFNALVDHVLTLVPPEVLTSLQVGNEIDGFDTRAEHPEFWSDYGFFLAAVAEHIHTRYPGLKVGYTGTHHGLTQGALRDLGVWTALATVVDVLGVTYYPLESDFGVRDPQDVFEDFDAIAQEFPGMPLYFQEIGYQSSGTNRSNQRQQAEFFCQAFQAWDQHRDQIHLMNMVRLNDASHEGALELAGPYGLDNEEFTEYLRTLGLRAWEGKPKEAYDLVLEEVGKRGW